MAVEQILEGDFSGVTTAAAGVGSTVYDVLLWAVVGIMVVVLIGLLFFLLQFKHKVRIRYVTKDGSYIIDDKARRKLDGGVTYWALLKSKINVTPPPRTAINITKKGKLVAECYITEDNPEPVWIEDKSDIESADFKPLTTQQRSLTVARIRKAESRKRLSLWDKIQQIVLPATMVIMVALPFVFWGEITDTSSAAMDKAGEVAVQNAKIAEQNARILSVLAGKVEAGELDITQNIPPDATPEGDGGG